MSGDRQAVKAKPYFDLPPGPELYRRNRRLAAKREGWPRGVLQACEKLDARCPGWQSSWSDGRYSAFRDGRRHGEPHAYGATPAKLIAVIKAWRWAT